jgi:hypothetical protein
MEARTDGSLRIISDGGIEEELAIIEVKPRTRLGKKDPATIRQESAQMVAWICSDAQQGPRKVPITRLACNVPVSVHRLIGCL